MAKGSSIFGALFIMWLVWIFMASGNEHRIERVCQPVVWTGNVFTSLAALTASDKNQQQVNNVFVKFDYGCRYTVWRLFFESEWLKEQELLKESNNFEGDES